MLARDASFRFPVVSIRQSQPIPLILHRLPIIGNYYSFANTYNKDARLFFTQGCVPSTAEGDDAPGSASKTDALDGESNTPPARSRPQKATAGKGRPKGKQKPAA